MLLCSASYTYKIRDGHQDHSDHDKCIDVRNKVGNDTQRDPNNQRHDCLLLFPIQKVAKADGPEEHSSDQDRRTAHQRQLLLFCRGQSLGDECLCFLLNPSEMLFPAKAFGVEFVHILGTGRAGGEPALLGDDFEPAD